jgi:uncharacterized protein YceH (UPF0502 family)
MEVTLSDAEVRVLGALIEKEITTPDNYPLSMNALIAACNQLSNRHPVVHFDESTVARALDGLREKKLAHLIKSDSRVVKFRHILYEAMNLGRPGIAVLCVLMLRGPQTVGEIRTRTNRLYDFSSLEEVETTLNSLASLELPLLCKVARQSGQKEARYAHLLSGEVKFTEVEPELESEPQQPQLDRLGKLEKEVEDLKRQFEQFRKQFE